MSYEMNRSPLTVVDEFLFAFTDRGLVGRIFLDMTDKKNFNITGTRFVS